MRDQNDIPEQSISFMYNSQFWTRLINSFVAFCDRYWIFLDARRFVDETKSFCLALMQNSCKVLTTSAGAWACFCLPWGVCGAPLHQCSLSSIDTSHVRISEKVANERRLDGLLHQPHHPPGLHVEPSSSTDSFVLHPLFYWSWFVANLWCWG